MNFNDYIDYYISELPLPPDAAIPKDYLKNAGPGGHFTLSSTELFTTDETILVSLHPYAANRFGEHFHDYFELIYLSRGSARQTINSKKLDLSEGDICILNPNASHTITTRSPSDLLFNIMIKKSLFQESFLCLLSENYLMSHFFITSLFTLSEQNSYLYFPREHNMKSVPLAEALITEFLGKKLGFHKAVECYLALLFTELLREHRKNIDRTNYAAMGNHNISDILSYISQNKSTATLESVSAAFHYNPSYLSTLIKTHTNMSFSDILKDARLREACSYLKNTNLSMDEIAELVGYSDRNYFHRVFKKVYGMTPAEYRRTM